MGAAASVRERQGKEWESPRAEWREELRNRLSQAGMLGRAESRQRKTVSKKKADKGP